MKKKDPIEDKMKDKTHSLEPPKENLNVVFVVVAY